MNKIYLIFVILSINIDKSRAQAVDIDGNVYNTVKIGDQTWMAENLKVTRFRNGDIIPLAKSSDELVRFGKEKRPARIIEMDSSGNMVVTYNWFAVNDPRGLAPIDWHIPHYIEWNILFSSIGEINKKYLKSSTGWTNYGNSTDQFGFNAKPTRKEADCSWWWSASEIETTNSYPRIYAHIVDVSWCEGMCDISNDCYIPNPFKDMNFGVRCVKNW